MLRYAVSAICAALRRRYAGCFATRTRYYVLPFTAAVVAARRHD